MNNEEYEKIYDALVSLQNRVAELGKDVDDLWITLTNAEKAANR